MPLPGETEKFINFLHHMSSLNPFFSFSNSSDYHCIVTPVTGLSCIILSHNLGFRFLLFCVHFSKGIDCRYFKLLVTQIYFPVHGEKGLLLFKSPRNLRNQLTFSQSALLVANFYRNLKKIYILHEFEDIKLL